MESKVQRSSVLYLEEGFPFQAYMYILSDYFSRGLYREREQHFQISRKGKIDWNRTIKTQKPFVQGTNAFYLDFVTRKSSAKENELITLIHEYCVYDSMRKIGWLFTSAEPAKPRIKLNAKLFKTVVNDKLRSTFNDRNRVLFANMLAVIEHLQDEDSPTDYKCGTNRFEYVWEAMIDKVFGIEGKEKYFPKTTWNLNAGSYNNASLEPDTIMVYGGNIYALAEVHILDNEKESRAYMNQLWAEVMELYRSGDRSLKLSAEMEHKMSLRRVDYMAEDTTTGMVQSWLDDFKGDYVCTYLIYNECFRQLGKPDPKAKAEINSIMNNTIVVWKVGPQHRFPQYGQQRSWIRDTVNDSETDENGFRELSDEECKQMELPKEWL